MILRQDAIDSRLKAGLATLKKFQNSSSTEIDHDPLIISPTPTLSPSANETTGAVDLRLGTWFLSFKREHSGSLLITQPTEGELEQNITKSHYVPFHRSYFLHPHSFVLACTLEWIRFPKDLAGYVVGKSSWGRRGLIIATAVGVHPGFSGCLTLELSNVGEIPIEIRPGMRICQLFLHTVATDPNMPSGDFNATNVVGSGSFAGSRRPRLGKISLKDDIVATTLQQTMPLC